MASRWHVNAVLRLIIKVVGCAFQVLPLGLIALVVSDAPFLIAGRIADAVGLPLRAADSWPSAVLPSGDCWSAR